MNFDQLQLLVAIEKNSGITTSELHNKFPQHKFLKITLSRLRKQGVIHLTTQSIFDPTVNQKIFQYQNSLTPVGLELLHQYRHLFEPGSISHSPQESAKKPGKVPPNKEIHANSVYLKAAASEEMKQDLVMQWAEYLVSKRYSELTDCPLAIKIAFEEIAEEIVTLCIKQIEE